MSYLKMPLPRSLSPARCKPTRRAKLATRWAPPAFLILVGLGLVWLFPREERTRQQALALQNDSVATEYLRSILLRHPDDLEVRIEIVRRAMNAGDGSAAASLQDSVHNAPTAQRRQVEMLVVDFYENQLNSIPRDAPEHAKALKNLQDALGQTLISLSTNEIDPEWLAEKLHRYSPDWLNQLYRQQAERDPGRAPFWFEKAAKEALAHSRYRQAADAYFSAQQASLDPAHRKRYFLEGIRTLQNGNLLNEALAEAARHEASYLSDREIVFYLVRLARSAGNQREADRYARKLMQLSLLDGLPIQQAAWSGSVQAETTGPVYWLRTAGTKRAPSFNDEAYKLAYDVFIGNRKLDDAMAVAQNALKHVPNDPNWIRRLAQVAEWSGHPGLALATWRQLAIRQNDKAAWQALARLAPGMLSNEDLLLLWKEKIAKGKLEDKDWREIKLLYERLSRSVEGAVFLETRFKTEPRPLFLEEAADLRNSMGDVDGALANYRRLAKAFGPRPDWALTEATLLYAQDRLQQAFDVMDAAKSKASDKNTTFWRVLGDLAWDLGQRKTAKESYVQLKASPDWQSEDTDRLLELLDEGQTEERIALSRAAWKKSHNIIYLNTVLGLFLDRDQLAASRALLAEMTAAELQTAMENSDFLSLRARYYLLAGDKINARADLERAHEKEPSAENKINLIWLLVDMGDSTTLGALLPRWERQATDDIDLAEALATGWQSLGNAQRALPWARKLFSEHSNDPAWLANYADLLDEAGEDDLAKQVRKQAWLTVRDQPVGNIEELQRQLRLSLAVEPVDKAEARLYRALLAGKNVLPGSATPEHDEALVNELAYAWFLSQDDDNRARYWYWQRYARKLADPSYLALRAASARGDTDTQQALLVRDTAAIYPANQITAATENKERKIAQDQAWAALEGAPSNDAQHQQLTELLLADRPSNISLRREYTYGDLRGWSTTLAGEQALTPSLRLGVEAFNLQRQWRAMNYTQSTRGLEATLNIQKEEKNSLNLTAGEYFGWKRHTGLLARKEGQYERWLYAGELGWKRPTDDNTELMLVGMQDQAAIEGGVQLDPETQARTRLSYALLLGQDNAFLGQRYQLDMTLNWTSNKRGEFSAELLGQVANYDKRNKVLPNYARFTSDGEPPNANELLPRSYGHASLTVGYGMIYRDEYTRAWHPFGSATLGHHTANGREYGWQLGIAGSALGHDHLSIYAGSSRNRGGSDNKYGGMFYQWLF